MRKLIDFCGLAASLCKQDIQERFAGSLLGSLWVFIWPLVQLFIYIIIFGKMMGGRFSGNAQVCSYGIYVAAGLLSWTCFANTLHRTSRVFVDKRHVIGKVNVDLKVFPLFICMAELLPFAAGVLLLALADLLSGWHPSPVLLAWMFFALYCQQVLAVGLGLFFASCAVFVRDTVEAVAIALQIAFWFTPIVYLPSILPDWVRNLLFINPMVHITGIFQQCFVFVDQISWASVLYAAIASHAALGLGLYVFNRLEKDIRDVL